MFMVKGVTFHLSFLYSVHKKFSLPPLLQVHMFSYQCSQLSTPESVIEVFNTAMRFQRNQDTTKYVPVVVLDEVGLAEDSPNLPLKVLHPLLEDGTEGADDSQEVMVSLSSFLAPFLPLSLSYSLTLSLSLFLSLSLSLSLSLFLSHFMFLFHSSAGHCQGKESSVYRNI